MGMEVLQYAKGFVLQTDEQLKPVSAVVGSALQLDGGAVFGMAPETWLEKGSLLHMDEPVEPSSAVEGSVLRVDGGPVFGVALEVYLVKGSLLQMDGGSVFGVALETWLGEGSLLQIDWSAVLRAVSEVGESALQTNWGVGLQVSFGSAIAESSVEKTHW